MESFLHYMFAPDGQAWYTGAFWSNQVQWTVVTLPSAGWIIKRMFLCSHRWCFRWGHHKVPHTHYRTCPKHTSKGSHLYYTHKYIAKHPKAYKHLKEQTNG